MMKAIDRARFIKHRAKTDAPRLQRWVRRNCLVKYSYQTDMFENGAFGSADKSLEIDRDHGVQKSFCTCTSGSFRIRSDNVQRTHKIEPHMRAPKFLLFETPSA